MRWFDYIRNKFNQVTERRGASERRKFIRHPVDVEIRLSRVSSRDSEGVLMSDLGDGGLAVQSEVFYKKGSRLIVQIPHIHPPFEAVGVVCWNRSLNGPYLIGIRFMDDSSTRQMRIVEQVCQIELYRKRLLAEGNSISFKDAAREWIDKYAEDFWRNQT